MNHKEMLSIMSDIILDDFDVDDFEVNEIGYSQLELTFNIEDFKLKLESEYITVNLNDGFSIVTSVTRDGNTGARGFKVPADIEASELKLKIVEHLMSCSLKFYM